MKYDLDGDRGEGKSRSEDCVSGSEFRRVREEERGIDGTGDEGSAEDRLLPVAAAESGWKNVCSLSGTSLFLNSVVSLPP